MSLRSIAIGTPYCHLSDGHLHRLLYTLKCGGNLHEPSNLYTCSTAAAKLGVTPTRVPAVPKGLGLARRPTIATSRPVLSCYAPPCYAGVRAVGVFLPVLARCKNRDRPRDRLRRF